MTKKTYTCHLYATVNLDYMLNNVSYLNSHHFNCFE